MKDHCSQAEYGQQAHCWMHKVKQCHKQWNEWQIENTDKQPVGQKRLHHAVVTQMPADDWSPCCSSPNRANILRAYLTANTADILWATLERTVSATP